jgi:hypothetical protein
MNIEQTPSWLIPFSILAVLYIVPALLKRRRDILERNRGKVITTSWHSNEPEKMRRFITENLHSLYSFSMNMRHASLNAEDSYIQFMIQPGSTELYCEVNNSESYTSAQKDYLRRLGFHSPGENPNKTLKTPSPNYSCTFSGSRERCISEATEICLNILNSIFEPAENEAIFIDIFDA